MLKISAPSVFRALSPAPYRARNATSLKAFRNRINYPGIGTYRPLPNYARRAHLVRINRVLLHLDKFLANNQWDKASRYLHSKLHTDSGISVNSARFDVYEHAISLFASYHRFGEASEAMETMVEEGFVPSLATRTKLAAHSLIQEGADGDAFLASLDSNLRHPDCDEKTLFQIIRFLGDTVNILPSLVDRVVQLWAKHHGSVSSPKIISYMVRMHGRIGVLGAAEGWLRQNVDHALKNGDSPNPAPYTSFLSALAETRSLRTEALAETVKRMQEDGVAPDLAVFNAIISSQLSKRRISEALDVYSLLYQSRGGALAPDAYTFSSLFQALSPLYQKRQELAKMPMIRDLYNNLLECHLIRTGGKLTSPSPTLNPSVLNHALELFMAHRDYPGAFVILSSFQQCNAPADVETSRIVVTSLLNRVNYESRVHFGHITREWSGRFLAGGEKNAEYNISEDSHTIRQILRHGKEPAKPQQVVKRPKYLHRNIIMAGDTRQSLPDRDLLSVKRIVKRAFLTDWDSPHYPGEEAPNPMKAFSLAISHAKSMMIPDAKDLRQYSGSRQQRAVDKRPRIELSLLPLR